MVRSGCSILFWVPLFALAQPGANDPTFNPNDRGYSSYGTGEVFDIALQPDGKILITGWVSWYNGVARGKVARLNIDGSLDETFDPGETNDPGPRNVVEVLSDGTILTGGYDYYGVKSYRADGTAHPGFFGASLMNWDFTSGGFVSALKQQPDGKVLVGGSFHYYNGQARQMMVRVQSNGSLDPSFNVGNFIYDVRAIEVQPDSRILVAGNILSGTYAHRVARLDPEGPYDGNFELGLGANAPVKSLALLPDGRIVAAGEFTMYDGVPCNRIIRLDPDGGIDPSFDLSQGANGTISSVTVQADGRMLIAGDFTSCSGVQRNNVARLNSDGSLDVSFHQLSGANNELHAIALQPDGKVLIGGALSNYDGRVRNGIARLGAEGGLDMEFNPATSANEAVQTIAVRSDGRIMIAGDFMAYGDIPRGRVALLDVNGGLDGSFDPGSGANQPIWTLAMQPDGKAIIGGSFTNYDGQLCGRIARLNEDGSLDTTFHTGAGAGGQVVSVGIGLGGKVLVSGGFNSFNGSTRRRIVRLNSDGSVDEGFDPGEGPNSVVWAFASQPDGKTLLVGNFTNFDYTPRNYVARLNADGHLDDSFDPGVGPDDRVVSIVSQPDGKILIGGYFHNYNGSARSGIARLNDNGSLDPSFDPGLGIAGQESGWDRIHSIILQPDGKILICGDFQTYDGFECGRIARLNPDGSRDVTFDPGSGANGIIGDMELLPSGNVLVAGYFTRYDEAKRGYVARVIGGIELGQDDPVFPYPNPTSQGSTISIALHPQPITNSNVQVRLVLADATGRTVREMEFGPNVPWLRLEVPRAAGFYHLGLWEGQQYLGGSKLVVE